MIFPDPIQHIDQQLFFLINRTWANQIFDLIFPPIRDQYFWIPLYILVAIFLVRNYRQKGFYLVLLLGFNFAVSDQMSSAVIKPWIQRERPCNNTMISDEVILRIDRCGVGKSFTSSHAANTFAFAMMLTLLLRKKFRWILPVSFSWAFMISYAQIYVGVHYPFDIIGGALLGIALATLLYMAAKKLFLSRIGWEY